MLTKEMRVGNINMFIRCETPNIDLSEYPNFIYEEHKDEFWMSWASYYCLFQLDESNGVLWNSTVCTGKSDMRLLGVAVRTLQSLFDEGYNIQAMGWESGYKSELIIKRVARHFNIILEADEYIVFTKKGDE